VRLLEATEDAELERLLVNYVFALQEHSPDRLDTLPEALQAHFTAFLMDVDVLNGGFNQFWFNSPGLAENAALALECLEMPEAARLASQAAALYETVRDRHDAARTNGSIEAFMATCKDSPSSALDAAYSSRESEWRHARISYIRRHLEEFTHP
jgi:hypothetical protein